MWSMTVVMLASWFTLVRVNTEKDLFDTTDTSVFWIDFDTRQSRTIFN